MTESISANIVDVINRRVFGGTVHVHDGHIERIDPDDKTYPTFLTPGFIDAHVHIESSMLVPTEFARLASIHGTVATVSDPHEIANVLGIAGVEYMIANAAQSPMKFFFGAPSCVPATKFETAGAELGIDEVSRLLAQPEIIYLAEVMNFPGVIAGDKQVLAKLAAAKNFGKRIDGHAPGLRGENARKYFAAGIETDHECYTLDEAKEKLALGVKILIREGSAARNFDALWPLLHEHPEACMFCSDDKHPDSLLQGHINKLVAAAVSRGVDPFNALRCACINPAEHYGLTAPGPARRSLGLLRPGDPADFVELENLGSFNVLRTWINGQLVAESGKTRIPSVPIQAINRFDARPKKPADFAVPRRGDSVHVIDAVDGQLVTGRFTWALAPDQKLIEPNLEKDILKIAVVERYGQNKMAVGFIRGFGLKRGAIASSVAHDSHNIVAVGVSDDAICRAVNAVIESRGGLAVVDGSDIELLRLSVAGIIGDAEASEVAKKYAELDRRAKLIGSTLKAPFMTLSFMALLVIGTLKISDQGLFDGTAFAPADLFVKGTPSA